VSATAQAPVGPESGAVRRPDVTPDAPTVRGRPARHEDDAAPVTVLGLLAILVESWKVVLLAALVGAALAAALVIPSPRTFTARMALVTVTASRGAGALGGVLGAAGISLGGGGVEPTPAFVLRLMKTETVRRAVALTPLPGSGRPLIAALNGGAPPPRPDLYGPLIGRAVVSTVERDGGTIMLSASHTDSAVARLLAERMLDETSGAFLRASRAQAAQQRAGQERRVAIAERNLRGAEAALLEFTRSNRVIETYATTFVERQQIERRVNQAQSVYSQAVSDRETAIAKELEETPALVVLDPIPDALAPNPKHTAAKMIVAAFAGGLIAAFWAIARGLLLGSGAADADRLRDAVRRLPLAGRLVRR
jgi:uncharacterized protein involved in exopolysaccharide biosynthesis